MPVPENVLDFLNFLTNISLSTKFISLHWLRVPERISFKLADMTYRFIHGTSPSYLQSCFTRAVDMTFRWRLRSFTSHCLDVLPVRLSTVGKRAIPVSGATVWNDLPLHVASAPSLAVFRQRLKTFLFSRSYQDTTPVLYDSCVAITIHHYGLDTHGLCYNWHYLGHVKNVYDDDDDDDDDDVDHFQPTRHVLLVPAVMYREPSALTSKSGTAASAVPADRMWIFLMLQNESRKTTNMRWAPSRMSIMSSRYNHFLISHNRVNIWPRCRQRHWFMGLLRPKPIIL